MEQRSRPWCPDCGEFDDEVLPAEAFAAPDLKPLTEQEYADLSYQVQEVECDRCGKVVELERSIAFLWTSRFKPTKG